MSSKESGAPAPEDGATARDGRADSPKRQGDKLAGSAGAALPADASTEARPGDSPKRHGDELAHAVGEAAKR
ncbi:hypothetical protein [Enterovirga sp.]|uniref:hypothetical protein n=1 Tax=Enterovirga sp. TaxID=2026350 RepID=UPI0026125DB4|nr:hypothetical protein [Enterovirga sp.]MDB5591795.1 hypothetical protein [Enterovirga sp.]